MDIKLIPERPQWAIKVKIEKGIPPAEDLIREMVAEGFFHVQMIKESSNEEHYYIFSTAPLPPYELLSWEEKKCEDLFGESFEAENHFFLGEKFPGAGTVPLSRSV